jgi:hypothetical protein
MKLPLEMPAVLRRMKPKDLNLTGMSGDRVADMIERLEKAKASIRASDAERVVIDAVVDEASKQLAAVCVAESWHTCCAYSLSGLRLYIRGVAEATCDVR